ncbi:MAG: sulfatase-like hydrolase/transferase, partial [Chloroflexota bacterium]
LQPVIRLFIVNVEDVYFLDAIRPMVLALLLGGASLLVAYFLLRNWIKASTVASLFMVLFFLFGDLSDRAIATFGLGPLRAAFLVLALILAVMFFWIWLVQKRIRNIGSLNLYFNLLSLLFLLTSGNQASGDPLGISVTLNQEPPAPVAVVQSATPRPDVYYIILDGYGREDILQSYYDLDNSDFLEALASKGFYVAGESSSNYMQTMLSMSSSLNMDYLQSLEASGTRIESRENLFDLLMNSKVRRVLAQNGYQTVSFRNAYLVTIPNAEIYYDDTGFAYPVTAFESMLIDRSLAHVLLYVPFFKKILIEMPYDAHRSQILSTFTRLKEIPALDGDYFVYAHIIAPHPPFVFDKNGQVLPHNEPFHLADGNNYIKGHSRASYVTGYREQIQYVNKLVLETVDAILTESETPPIIIIQGDHGPGSHLHFGSLNKTQPAERFGILNAYYFPDQDYTSLYPSISPVNSFRVVLGQFFDDPSALLPDRHYYSTWGEPFDFVEVRDLPLP